jgi:hypothetical protein
VHSVHAGSSPVLGTPFTTKMTGIMSIDRKVCMVPVFFMLLILWFPGSLSAQEVIVCRSHQSGVPKDASAEWTAEQFPLTLTLFYHNGKTTITERSLNFIIEAEDGAGIGPFEESIVVSQGRNWASIDFSFPRSGKYAVSAYRADRSVMARTEVTINGPETSQAEAVAGSISALAAPQPSKPSQQGGSSERSAMHGEPSVVVQVPPAPRVPVTQELSEQDAKTLRFDFVNIAFGSAVRDRRLVDAGERFNDVQSRKGLVVQLSNSKPLGTRSFTVDVWRRSGSSQEHDEMILEKQVEVDPTSYTAQTELILFKKGDYKVTFFTDDLVWIGSGFLTVE